MRRLIHAKAALFVAPMILGGCAVMHAMDRYEMSKLVVMEYNRFRFSAMADLIHPHDSNDAEEIRMGWLKDWVADLKICPHGYEIISREVREQLYGIVPDVIYIGRCKVRREV